MSEEFKRMSDSLRAEVSGACEPLAGVLELKVMSSASTEHAVNCGGRAISLAPGLDVGVHACVFAPHVCRKTVLEAIVLYLTHEKSAMPLL